MAKHNESNKNNHTKIIKKYINVYFCKCQNLSFDQMNLLPQRSYKKLEKISYTNESIIYNKIEHLKYDVNIYPSKDKIPISISKYILK